MLQIRLLGRVEVAISGVPMRGLRGKSGLWLLGILTLQARPVERDWLAGVLWPDSAPDAGRANLRRTLTDLRAALGDAAPRLVSPTAQTIGLTVAPHEADVRAFRAGDLAQYGGELMPGCPLEWVEAERRVLEERYLTQGEKEAATLPPDAALALLEKLRLHAPLRESLLRLQLTALCQRGNRAEAQQLYYAFRRSLLEQRLGEPAAQTQEHWKGLQSFPEPVAAPAMDSPAIALPTPLTPLLGRKDELDALARLLATHRLVTITGLGGMGKTRLAVEAARIAAQPVVFLELAECRDPHQLTQILQALPSPDDATPTLLVLDNFEQLVGPEANRAVRELLEARAGWRCLVTSRRALGLAGEQVFPLAPLESPQHPGLPQRLEEFASMALLTRQARAVQPAFALTPQNAASLIALCQQAEGIPLALELLAAHLRVLSPDTLLAQVRQARLPLLARYGEGNNPRHGSLGRIIESSVAPLAPWQQTGFYHLGVFRGGWSLEAAQAVCAPLSLLDLVTLLETLTDNCLVRFAGERYSQLETLREWSLAAQPDGVRDGARRRHAAFFLDFAEQHAAKPEGLTALDPENDNLRAAFDTFLETGDTASALRWSRALRLYWFHRRGGQPLLERLLTCVTDPAERAEVQENLGVLCALNGEWGAADDHLGAALTYFRDVGDMLTQAKITSNRAGMAIERGDLALARTGLEQALPLWRGLNQPRSLGITLTNLGIVLMNQNDLEAAEPLIAQALLLRQRLGDTYGIATNLVNRGSLEIRRGANREAEATYREALPHFRALGDRRGEVICLEGLAEVFLNQGQLPEARRFFQESQWLRGEYGLPVAALEARTNARIRRELEEAAIPPAPANLQYQE